MSRLCFIVNPTAGHGRSLKSWRQLEPIAAAMGEYGVKFTAYPRHGEELARQAVLEGYDRIVALGGDGTINEVGNGLVGTAAALAVVPTGTGNDWVRTVGIPRSPEAAMQIAFTGKVVRADVGLAVGHRCFFNIAGIGFDAEVACRVNRYGPVLKAVGGTLPSLLGIMATLFSFGGAKVLVQLDDQEWAIDRMLLLAVGIMKYYGGGMKILPDAIMDDALFDIVWGQDLSRMELIGLVRKIYSGRHVGHPAVHFSRGRRLTVRSELPVSFHLDGDLAGSLPVTMELLPSALSIVLP